MSIGFYPDKYSSAQPDKQPKTPIIEEEEAKPEKDPPIPANAKALNKQKTLFFEKTEKGQRKVYLLAKVCLREGPLEVFLCKFQTKEHEAIVHCEVDAIDLNQALLVTGAKSGKPVTFRPKYVPASGDEIQVSLTYHKDGKLVEKPARHWIRNSKTKKELDSAWVFAGSRFLDDENSPNKKYFTANNGELISLSNFPDSLMDLPVPSPDGNDNLLFEAWTERIPPRETKVLITLEPVRKKD